MKLSHKSHRRSKQIAIRDGVAVVELAICIPLIFLLTIGTLEVCEGIFLKQKVAIASHEGARIAIQKSSTIEDVRAAVAQYLDARRLNYSSIEEIVTCTPSPESAQELTPISVRVEVDVDANSRMPLSFYSYFQGESIVAEVTMYKEYSANGT